MSGLLLVVAGLLLLAATALVDLRYRELLPEDALVWGSLSLAALGAGMGLLGARRLLERAK